VGASRLRVNVVSMCLISLVQILLFMICVLKIESLLALLILVINVPNSFMLMRYSFQTTGDLIRKIPSLNFMHIVGYSGCEYS